LDPLVEEPARVRAAPGEPNGLTRWSSAPESSPRTSAQFPQRREHEDRKWAVARGRPAHRDPIEAGQHHIEDHQVKRSVACAAQGVVAIACDHDLVTLGRQDALQGRSQPGVVLDHEDERASHLSGDI
jgi:hypothetical protein